MSGDLQVDDGPISITDFFQHLNVDPPPPSDKQGPYRRALDAAVQVVQNRCGPIRPTATAHRIHQSGPHLVLPATHLVEVGQVLDPDGNAVTPVEVNLLAGIVTMRTHRAGAWTVNASRGDEANPSLELAALIIAKHLWETTRGTAWARGRAQGAESQDPVPSGFAIPRRAAELMADYSQRAFFA